MSKDNIKIKSVSIPRSSGEEIEILFLASDGEELRLNLPMSELPNLIEPLLNAAAATAITQELEPSLDELTELPQLLHARNVGLSAQQMNDGLNVVLYSPTFEGIRILLAFEPSLFQKLAGYAAEIQNTQFSDNVQ